jgi:hypothetical protein
MKKYLLIPFLLIFALSAKSQVLISILLGDKLNSDKLEFGLNGGLDWSTLYGLPRATNHTGFNLGFYFDFKFNDPSWMLNTGVIVKSPMGANDLPVYSLHNPKLDSAFAGGRVAKNVRYFNVPIMIKHKFDNNIYFEGGTQLGLRANAFDEFTNTVVEKNDLKYKLNTKDEYRPLDAGLTVGAGYRFLGGNGMNLELRYYFGLVDIVIDEATPAQFNRVLYLTVGIPIGKGKAAKKNNPNNPK